MVILSGGTISVDLATGSLIVKDSVGDIISTHFLDTLSGYSVDSLEGQPFDANNQRSYIDEVGVIWTQTQTDLGEWIVTNNLGYQKIETTAYNAEGQKTGETIVSTTGDNYTIVYTYTDAGTIEYISGVKQAGDTLANIDMTISYDLNGDLIDFSATWENAMPVDTIIKGTPGDDILTVYSNTTSVQADAGTDTAVFSGNYADYTFSQSNSFVPLITHNTANQVVSLFGVEQLQFDDGVVNLETTSSGEFQVSTYSGNHIVSNQSGASVTALNDGGFVVVWGSYGQDGWWYNGWSIYGQRYDADGNTVGGEFLVNTYIEADQADSSIAALADGGFIVTWYSGQDGDSYSVHAQRYDNNGNAIDGEFQVNTSTEGGQLYATVAALTDGGFVISWINRDISEGVFAQIYNVDGTTQGDEFQVNNDYSVWTGTNNNPGIIGLTDGGFVISWSSNHYNNDDGDGYGVFAQMYNDDGSTQGTEFQVNTYTISNQSGSSIAALNDGGFLIAWNSAGQDGTSYSNSSVYGQRYDVDGNKISVEFLINSQIEHGQSIGSIETLNDGGFVVVWTSEYQDDSVWNGGVYGQRYDINGNTAGNEFQVNTYVTDDQGDPDITALTDGGFVITWTSNEQDGDGSGIFSQRYDSEGNPLGTNTLTFDAAPTIVTPITDASINEDVSYSYDTSPNFIDVDTNDVLTYSAALSNGSVLPSWLSMNSTTGVLSGTPLNGGGDAMNITVTATDTAGANVSDTYTLTIINNDEIFTLDSSVNTIDGGYGNDTLTIGHTFVDYSVGISTDGTVVIRDSSNNITTITDVENFTFSDQAFDIAGLQASDDVRELFYEMVSDGVGGYDQVYVLPELFYDPNNAGLNELFDYTYTKPADDTQGDIIIGSAGNEFINSSGGDDAVDAGAGNDIIDGGLGSNFLTGGIGNDIFFADGRDAAIVETWTTITDFNAGTNSASLWGYIDGTSHYLWEENQGAGTVGGVDYNGVTFRGDLDGNGVIDTSFTFTGLTLNDISVSTNSISNDIGETEHYYSFSLVA